MLYKVKAKFHTALLAEFFTKLNEGDSFWNHLSKQ